MAQRDVNKNGSGPASHTTHPIDAIHMLKADHQKVMQLFAQFLSRNAAESPALVVQIFRELKVHSLLEEELFYPALHTHGNPDSLSGIDGNTNGEDVLEVQDKGDNANGESSSDMIMSAYDDHRLMRDHIRQLLQWEVSDAQFREGMVQLQELVIEHVFVEEAELFPQAQLTIDVITLGRQMQERKTALLSAAA